jgi:CSLREA domain-containing protein
MVGYRRGRGRAGAAVLALVALMAGVLVLAGASPAGAATVITVTTTADVVDPDDGVVSLREAVATANTNAGDETIDLAAGATYTVTNCTAYNGFEFRNAGAVTIHGNGSTVVQPCLASGSTHQPGIYAYQTALAIDHLTILQAGRALEVFGTVPSVSLLLDHVTVRDSSAGCIRVEKDLPAVVRFTTVDGCVGYGISVGLAKDSAMELRVEDSEVTGVKSASQLDDLGSISTIRVHLERTSVHDNPLGGVTAIRSATVLDSHIDHNQGSLPGLLASHDVVIRDSTIDDNDNLFGPAPFGRGAVGLWFGGTLDMQRTSVSRNRGGFAGVFASNAAGAAEISDSSIDGNVGASAEPSNQTGAGYANRDPASVAPLHLTRSTVNGNSGRALAGVWGRTPTSIVDSDISGNTVTDHDPTIVSAAVMVDASLTMTGSTVSGNTVAPSGTAVPTAAVHARTATLENDTISGNRADVGGLYARESGSLRHVTLADNFGPIARHVAASGPVSFGATALSSALTDVNPPCSAVADPAAPGATGSFTSIGYNVSTTPGCALAQATDQFGIEALLGPLAANGGATPTHLPLWGSPLTDRIPIGSGPLCTGADQRHVPRPQGMGCDIGAVEARGASFHALTPSRILDTRLPGGGGKLSSTTERTLQVTGGAVPPTASAVVLNVTATGSTANSFLSVFPQGTVQNTTSVLNFGPGQTIPNLVTARVSLAQTVTMQTAQGETDVVVDLLGYFDDGTGPGDGWVGVDPVRVLDSRTPTGGWNARLAAGASREVTVRGVSTVPVAATAVVANVTVTDSDSNSFLSVWPSGVARPGSSNLNFAARETIANGVIVPVGADGKLSVATAVGTTHVVIDVVGYFTAGAGSRYFPGKPTRVLDSRAHVGSPGPWGPGQTRSVSLTSSSIAPNATGVAMNLTATNGTAGSFLTAFPHGVPKPTASALNFGPGQTIANHSLLRIAAGQLDIANHLGTVDVVGDVVGYFQVPT